VNRAVYLSSSCVRGLRIGDVVEAIARSGITHIELSGGTEYYDSVEEDLLRLKEEYGLSYLVHGYFPPPEEDFMIDLVRGRERAFDFFGNTIEIAKKLGCDMYSTHAGFTVDVLPLTRGEPLGGQPPMEKRAAEEILYNNLQSVMEEVVGPDFRFAVENMFLEFSRRYPNLGMLLDLGHLNLAASVAGFDRRGFVEDILTNYADKVFEVHISENDGMEDTHDIPAGDSWQIEVAGWEDLREVPATFEWRGVDSAEAVRCYREFLRSPVFA
jgi:sugar phosphate isomerase/epimerase